MSVTNKAICIVALVILSLSGFHLYTGLAQYNRDFERSLSLEQEEFDHVIVTLNRYLFDFYEVHLATYCSSPSPAMRAFADRDRARLQALTLPFYNELRRGDPYLRVMQFHLPDGTTFLRMQEPGAFGDDLRVSHPAVQFVHQHRQRLTGYEIGPYGAFYRIIQPVTDDRGHYLGAVELGIDVAQLVDAVQKRLGVEAAAYFLRSEWEKATRALPGQRFDFGAYVLASDGNDIWQRLPADFDLAGGRREVRLGGRTYILQPHPILARCLGEPLGGILSMQDVTGAVLRKQVFVRRSVMVSMLLLALSLVVLSLSFKVLIGRSDRLRARQEELIAALTSEVGERKRTEGELDRLGQRYRLILDAAGEGIFGVDREGRTTFANPTAVSLSGYSREELVGGHHHALLHHSRPDGAPYPMAECPVHAVLADGKVRSVRDEVYWRKDGTPLPVEYVATPVFEGEIIVGAVVVYRDTSERRELEGQLLQAQKMEAIGRLAGGIAHDFNNMLSAIIGYSEVTMMDLGAGHRLRKNVEAIFDTSQRAAALVRKLLAFGRKQRLEMEAVRLGAVVAGLAKLMGRLLGQDIELELRPAADEGQVLADATQLEQVLLNLVVNAKDAMPDGGRLVVATDVTSVAQQDAVCGETVPAGRYARLLVSDTGEGMAPEVLARAFEPFFTTKPVGKGTGLGLATVHGIVKQHKGYVTVTSVVGEGTSFAVLLPLLSGEGHGDLASLPPEARRRMPHGTETILVVNDDDAVRNMVLDVLTPLGYRLLAAASGEEALALSRERGERIDLLLADVVMPGIPGWKLAEELSELRPGIKILLMSGYTEETFLLQGGLPSGWVFVHKPLLPSELAVKLRGLFDAPA